MSVTTGGGDAGETALLFGRRVSKTHPRVVTYGTVDELNCALGTVRAALPEDTPLRGELREIQKLLQRINTELATDDADQQRLESSGIALLEDAHSEHLTARIATLEEQLPQIREFLLPGDSVPSAALHMARAICRRAEREVWQLRTGNTQVRDLLPRYLNRLSDYLWLTARTV